MKRVNNNHEHACEIARLKTHLQLEINALFLCLMARFYFKFFLLDLSVLVCHIGIKELILFDEAINFWCYCNWSET